MNTRYIVLIPHEGHEADVVGLAGRICAGLPNWAASRAGNAHLFVPAGTRPVDVGGQGWLAGDVFPRHGQFERVAELDEAEAAAFLCRDRGHLLTRFWGNYAAVLPGDDGWTILRAPLGVLPVLHTRSEECTAIASDASALVSAGLLNPAIDWAEVARTHYWRDLPSTRTAFANLAELPPGCELALDRRGHGILRERWSPWPFALAAPPPTAEQMRRTVQNAVAALVSPFEHPLLGLSGGLDSSVLAACLGRGPKRFQALTMTSVGDGDERAFAEPVARARGAVLTERAYALGDIDLDRSTAAHQPRPCGWVHEHGYREAVLRVAAASQADVFVTGNGGDNVFYNSNSARVVLDRLHCQGPGRAILRAISDVAALTGASAWQVGVEACRVALASGRRYRWRGHPRFLTADAADAAAAIPPEHPWLEAPRRALPGKSAHIAMILRMQNHLDTLDREQSLPLVSPLASQPVVELCLAMPSWDSVRDGRDRMLVRTAFAKDLPPAVIERRSKGSPGGFALQVLESFLPAVRERLLDGELASRGILDRPALEAALRPDRLTSGTDRPLVLALLDTEAWVRHWQAIATAPPPASGRPEAPASRR